MITIDVHFKLVLNLWLINFEKSEVSGYKMSVLMQFIFLLINARIKGYNTFNSLNSQKKVKRLIVNLY